MDWRSIWKNIWPPRPEQPIRVPAPGSEATQDFESVAPLSLPAEDVKLLVGVVSTRGNVRPTNEDNYYVPGIPGVQVDDFTLDSSLSSVAPTGEADAVTGGTLITGPVGLFIVADGMGGQLAGEKASQMAVEIIPAEMGKRLVSAGESKKLVQIVKESVAEANREILAQSLLRLEYSNMGTTVALVLFQNARAIVTGIGDSRVYHLSAGKMNQLTRDHSLAQALEDSGTIRPEEVENHRFRNVLYLYLGSRDAESGPEEIKVVEYRSGEQFLLATDGLTGVVKDDAIIQILESSADPQRAAQNLVNRALENGSRDNITCVVVQIV